MRWCPCCFLVAWTKRGNLLSAISLIDITSLICYFYLLQLILHFIAICCKTNFIFSQRIKYAKSNLIRKTVKCIPKHLSVYNAQNHLFSIETNPLTARYWWRRRKKNKNNVRWKSLTTASWMNMRTCTTKHLNWR